MFSQVFLAMTAREMADYSPQRSAYMGCHFSPYSKGLSNLPVQLQENSILLLDDSMPVQDHDPAQVVRQLNNLTEQFSVQALLLDFQREKDTQTQQMAEAILTGVSCRTAVTPPYADSLDCSVFLPPAPVNMSLRKYLHLWKKRDIYLEISIEQAQFTVSENGSFQSFLPPNEPNQLPHWDQTLHCHYKTEVFSDKVIFTLQRTAEDLAELTEEAYRLGVRGVVGLYQELINPPTK